MLTKGEKSIYVSVRLTQAQKAALEVARHREGKTPSAIIREALRLREAVKSAFAVGAGLPAK